MPGRNLISAKLEWVLVILILAVIAGVYAVTFYPDQGWGDDFAQYIAQAVNIAEGRNMADTGYIYSRYTPEVGPRAYPPGFPVMLAPVYSLFGLNIGAFQVFIILLQLIALVLIYVLYHGNVSPLVALVLLLMMGLSPYLIGFKRDIMSDTPFMLVCIAFLVWIERTYLRGRSGGGAVVGAVLLAFLCYFVRTIGFVVLLALLLSDLLTLRRISRFTLLVGAGTVALVVVSRLIIGGGEESYFDQFSGYSPLILLQNIDHYFIKSIRGFWAGPSLTFGSVIAPILWLIAVPLIIVGFVRRARSGGRLFVELFFVLYMLIILAWPSIQELRFLYPILPLLLLYAGIGFEGMVEWVGRRISLPIAAAGAALFGLGILGIYAIRTMDVVQGEIPLSDGPYTAPAQELFAWVSTSTEPDAVFMFYKPRALALYTRRDASTFPLDQSDEVVSAYLAEIGTDYMIVRPESYADATQQNDQLRAFLAAHPDLVTPVTDFQSEQFQIYRVNLD